MIRTGGRTRSPAFRTAIGPNYPLGTASGWNGGNPGAESDRIGVKSDPCLETPQTPQAVCVVAPPMLCSLIGQRRLVLGCLTALTLAVVLGEALGAENATKMLDF